MRNNFFTEKNNFLSKKSQAKAPYIAFQHIHSSATLPLVNSPSITPRFALHKHSRKDHTPFTMQGL